MKENLSVIPNFDINDTNSLLNLYIKVKKAKNH